MVVVVVKCAVAAVGVVCVMCGGGSEAGRGVGCYAPLTASLAFVAAAAATATRAEQLSPGCMHSGCVGASPLRFGLWVPAALVVHEVMVLLVVQL